MVLLIVIAMPLDQAAPLLLTAAGVTGNPLGLAGEWRWMVVAEEGAVGVERGL